MYKIAVIGRGLIGSAAGRHLSMISDGIAVIGPNEPEDPVKHEGVFASHYDEGRIVRFVDPQINGPYTFWHHTHMVQAVEGGVEIIDKVKYSLPLGWLGTLAHSIWVRKDLEKIFEHRKNVIQNYFEIINISTERIIKS